MADETVDEIDIEEFHTGNGWYDIPGATKQVRGEEAARKKLAEVLEEGPEEEADAEDAEEVVEEVEEVTDEEVESPPEPSSEPEPDDASEPDEPEPEPEGDEDEEEYDPYSHIPVQMRPKKPTRAGLPPVQTIPKQHRGRVLEGIAEAEAADAEPEESDEEE